MIQPQRLLERFLRYVQIDTTAGDPATGYPSSPGQLALGGMLADELRQIGLADVEHDRFGLVYATLPATIDTPAPTIAFNAHLDTSPETTGKNVRPQVVRNYSGGDLVLPGNPQQVIRTADNPELHELRGRTLITTDGTTLLGADDKAGIAAIVEAMHALRENPQVPHGTIRVLLTCDEEIGHGVDHVDLARLAAQVAYTLDGPGAGTIDVETFSADLATVRIQGVNIHPSIARGRMVNAVRIAGEFLRRLPRDRLAPECTDQRDGFLHPYVVQGGVAEVRLRILLRDFDTPRLAEYAGLLRHVAAEVQQEFPGSNITLDIEKQYRNLGEGLAREPRAVALAEEAMRQVGLVPRQTVIRGGTDGSRLTELGLPTPNLSTGQHNPHSPLEWACLEEMVQAAQVVIALCQLWGQQPPTGGEASRRA